MNAVKIKLLNGPGGGLTLGANLEADARPPQYLVYWVDEADGPQVAKLSPGEDLRAGGAAYERAPGASNPAWGYRWVQRLKDME